jgi:(p)ppGpp synthase/HD superfamily hydrolase
VNGYSDRINHALSFAAKHHDRQVHKGTRAPYRTHSANVAIILTRYAQPDATVIAGILYDVVRDAVRERQTREMLDQRIAEKFGSEILEAILSVTPRVNDETGVEFTHEERRDDLLARLGDAGDTARWIVAADALHEASTALADLRRTIDPGAVWRSLPLGRQGTPRWYGRLRDRLVSLGFAAPIMNELGGTVDDLAALARSEP